MNKQDNIKKVIREFKNGKLKTPNGEVVTDKKQALAIANLISNNTNKLK